MSDSGGFQILSLMSAAGARACVTERGLSYRHGPSKRILTPAKSIRRQLRLGADVVFCLDYCTHPDEPTEAQARSVRYTVKWARECKAEFERALSERTADGPRPALFAVVQGGADPELRRQCADALIALGFDGYGFGGWPVASDGRLVEAVGWVADLLPKEAPKHGLGIGKPENIVAAWRAGYTSFDSTLPTRDARRGRLFVARDLAAPLPAGGSFYEYLYIADEAHRRSDQPIDSTCSCLCCSRYSRGYLRHLFDVKDGLAHRLASLHNLSFYARLMEAMRGEARAS